MYLMNWLTETEYCISVCRGTGWGAKGRGGGLGINVHGIKLCSVQKGKESERIHCKGGEFKRDFDASGVVRRKEI